MKINILFTLFAVFVFQGLSAQSSEGNGDFYDVNTVQEINITFSGDNWQNDLDSLRYNGNGLLLGKVDINGQTFNNAGVRFRGSKSFRPGSKRNALHIKLNYIDKRQNIQGHQTIKLSNALRDPSMVREVLSYEIARNYMPAPKANYARVNVNGETYGLFVNVEAVDENFLNKQFGSSENAFFKVNQNAGEDTPPGCQNKIYGSLEHEEGANCYLNNFEKISEHGWDDLIELTNTLNNKTADIGKVLNVDRTLWMLAFNNVLVNLSSYSGQQSVNYYLYKDDSGQFSPIVWDLNLSFGSFKNTGEGSDLDLKKLQNLDPLLHADNVRKPLISKLLQNDTYKKVYLSHMRSIVNDFFINGSYEQKARAYQDMIREDFDKDPGQRYKISDFAVSLNSTVGQRSKIPGIIELMEKRSKYLFKHPSLAVFPPEISDVKVLGRAKFSSANVSNFKVNAKVDRFPKRVKLMYRLGSNDAFSSTMMYDDGKHNDGAENDGIYGAVVSPENGESSIQYYIEAENATLFGYSPSNYMWDVHSATLEALNK